MPTNAKGGFGTQLLRDDGPGTFVAINEVPDINGLDESQIMEDATSMDSPGVTEKVPVGLRELGEITFQVPFVPTDSTHAALKTDLDSTTLRHWRIVLPSGTRRISFDAYVSKMSASFPVKGIMMRDVTLTPITPQVLEAHP